jgi:hypothetical protein
MPTTTDTEGQKLDWVTLEWAAKWIEGSLSGETDNRVIEFAKNMAMTLRAAKPPIDFTCRVCGLTCDIAPDPPERAVCPEHCEDHDYRYERELRGHYCFHCGEEAPPDLYED